MKKAADAFRSIGEVSQLVGVAPHVLRYWEAQFPLFSPVKRRDGRRYYRPDDVKLAAGLCEMLREEGVSIRGMKKQMAADRGAALKARGAARLGDVFADLAPPEAESAPQAASQAGNQPAVAPQPASRRRKPAADDGTLPLFADFAAPAAPASADEATPAASRLARLQAARTALRDLAPGAAPAADLARLLDRLSKARDSLSR